jgi:hypothetical protein
MGRLALAFLLLSFPAAAGTLGDPYEHWTKEAVRRLGEDSRDRENWVGAFQERWNALCGPSSAGDCVLHECDVVPAKECRAKRILLFRGEDRDPSVFSLSGLARNHWKGLAFAPDVDAPGLMRRLHDEMEAFRPVDRPPTDGGPVVLDPSSGTRRWIYGETPDSVYKPGATGPALTFLQILAFFHVESSYLYFNDPALGPVSIDPLISYSASPLVATGFGHRGRLIVLSVPEDEILPDCGEEVPKPGRILNGHLCESQTAFPLEREFDVVLFPLPHLVWKSFALRDRTPSSTHAWTEPAWMKKFRRAKHVSTH